MKSVKDYRKMATEALGTVGSVAALGGMFLNQPALIDDSIAFAMHAESVGGELGKIAEQNSLVAKLLETFAEIGRAHV